MPPFPFQNPQQNPTPPNPLQFNLSSFLSSVQSSAHAFLSHVCPVGPIPVSPLWCRIASNPSLTLSSSELSEPLSTIPMKETPGFKEYKIAERLEGIPVYALSNGEDEFVLVSGARTGKSLGLFCFKKEDAEAMLREMKGMDMQMKKDGSKVVPVALNKVFKLKIDGIAFRFVPDASQVAKAITVMEKGGAFTGGTFPGVPVFQSNSLFVRSGDKRYHPVFFRKEDLDESLVKASRHEKKLNAASKIGDIQVTVLEEMIKAMTDGSSNEWDNVVFVPPGFEMSVGKK